MDNTWLENLLKHLCNPSAFISVHQRLNCFARSLRRNQNRIVALTESGILPVLVKWRLHHYALACAAFITVDRQS